MAELKADYATLPAIIDANGSATFAELDAQSANLARSLLAAGVSKGARIGILMPNGQDYLVALFAALRIGAVAVLVSTLARPPELAQMIRVADVDILLSADHYLRNDYCTLLEAALPDLATSQSDRRLALMGAPFLRAIWIWGKHHPAWARSGTKAVAESQDQSDINAEFLLAAQNEIVPADPALIIFTSGSSAEPKAVVHSQANVVRQGKALAELMGGCGPGDKLLSTMPFFWVGGLCTVVLAALCSGTAVICPSDPSTEATMAALRKHDATHIMHWPQQLDLMKDDPEFREMLSRMRPAYAHQYELFDLVPTELNANTIGMTETLGPHHMLPLGALPKEKIGSYGTPVSGIEHRIIDPETGEDMPTGELGQLCLRGGSLLTGMHRKQHHEVFDERGFYRTDDVARVDDDGHIFFAGRGDDIVKISGANVSPVEVEGAIRELDGVKAVCVVGLTPEGNEITLAAAIIPEDGASLDADAMRAQLKQRLSSYKVPRHYVMLREDELPMTASAKIYKPALKELLLERISG
ncbi:MAG: class I adenylate-forming enzyme family protein [Novosphingobium sp.]|nr:acyl--CoA ligase [Novosphingobium sp.]